LIAAAHSVSTLQRLEEAVSSRSRSSSRPLSRTGLWWGLDGNLQGTTGRAANRRAWESAGGHVVWCGHCGGGLPRPSPGRARRGARGGPEEATFSTHHERPRAPRGWWSGRTGGSARCSCVPCPAPAAVVVVVWDSARVRVIPLGSAVRSAIARKGLAAWTRTRQAWG
jgi:hypothetical protein